MLLVSHALAVRPDTRMDFGVIIRLSNCAEYICLMLEALDLKKDSLSLVEEPGSDACRQSNCDLAIRQALNLLVLEPVKTDSTTNVDVRKCKLGSRHSIVWKPIKTLSDVVGILRINGKLTSVQGPLDVSDELSGLSGKAHSQGNILPLRPGTVSIGDPFLQKDDADSGDDSENGPYGLNPGRPVGPTANNLNRNAHSANAVMILDAAA